MAGDIQTTSGSKFYISDTPVAATVDTIAEWEGITTWVEIGLIEDLGELGDVSSEVTGAAIGDGRIRKAKGARNAGTMAVIAFRDPFDTGQAAVIAAEQTNDNYGFKLVPDDSAAPGTPTTLYFRGLVMSRAERYGTNDNIMRRVFNIGVNSFITEDPATTGP